MVHVVNFPSPPGAAARERPLQTFGSPYRNSLGHDPLLQQLRRISRAANVDTSITDKADDIRAKLHGARRSPHDLTKTLQKANQSPTSMFKTKATGIPELHLELHERMEEIPLISPRPATAPSSQSQDMGSFLTSLAPPRRTSRPTSRDSKRSADFEWPSAHQPDHRMVSTPKAGLTPYSHAYSTQALTAARNALSSPSADRAQSAPGASRAAMAAIALQSGGMHGSARIVPEADEGEQQLGCSGIAVTSASDYLAADDSASLHRRSDDHEHGASILSRVIASSERLELELTHATYEATTVSKKAVEAARLEALRVHLKGLRAAVSLTPVHVMQREKERANDLDKELATMRHKMKLARHEIDRLKQMLHGTTHGGSSRVSERSGCGQKAAGVGAEASEEQRDEAHVTMNARERFALLQQLEDAEWRVEVAEQKQTEERETAAKALADAQSDAARQLASTRARVVELENELALTKNARG